MQRSDIYGVPGENMKIFKNDSKGFTLVEVLVSVTIVAVLCTSLILAATQHIVYSKKIDSIYACSNLAKERVNSLRTYLFSDLASAEETAVRISRNGVEDISGEFCRTTEVEEEFDGNPYMARIKVSVDRVEDGSAAGKPVIMETIFTDIE
jgi:prepilin-type N-terminal cleavage/methylation domain-containing protein